MSQNAEVQPSYNKKVSWIAHTLVTIVILLVAFGVVAALFSSKPEARRWGGGQPAPSVAVDITDLSISNYEVWIDSYGTAEPLTRTELVSDVNAKVIEVSPNIRAGAKFKKGEVLVRLDDRDFQVEVDIAKSTAAEAEVRYLQEVAEAELAAQRWNEQPTNEAARLLSLRKPQVAAAEANLRAAKARLERAELNLDRTQIKAPFDGMVLRQTVDVGQVVNPSQSIAEIYSTDVVEVRLPVKVGDLDHLYLPEDSNDPNARPKVQLLGEFGSRTYEWQAEIVRSEGAFDPSTRQLFVVAQVKDPFVSTEQAPALRVGQFLRAKIQGSTLNDVFVIPRLAVSQDNRVSLAVEGLLRKRTVQPLWTDAQNVIVKADLASDSALDIAGNVSPSLNVTDKLILTPTANLPDGTRVKSITEGQPQRDRSAIAQNNSGAASGAKTAASSQ